MRNNQTLTSGAISALSVSFSAFQAKNFGGLFDVPAGFFQRVLRVDHSGSQLLTQLLDVFE